MGEIRDLIGIYGAIDRAVIEDSGRRGRVSRLVPLYAKEDVRWFDEFEAWTLERRTSDTDEPPFPRSLTEALSGLARTPARGRMRARRLWALAVAAQAFPEILAGDGEAAALAREAVGGAGGIEDDAARGRLLELLGDTGPLAGADPADLEALHAWWSSVMQQAFAEGLVPDPATLGPRPCTGRLVTVGSDPTATLTTRFETDQVGFDQAISFLEPSNWPRCNSFWCEMTRLGESPPVVHYREVVSTDCTSPAAAWTVRAALDFRFSRIGGAVAIAEYRMTPGAPNPDVLVDEGSLIVRRLDPAAQTPLEVTTTKRVRFDHPFSGEALALIMCALGYASVAEDLVYTCAALDPGSGTGFPEAPHTVAPDLGSVIKALGDEAAAAIKACADDCAAAVDATSEKVAAGAYTADALVQDMASMWVRLLREGARGVSAGARAAQAAQAAARPRAREDSSS